jgi:hypothetical protein
MRKLGFVKGGLAALTAAWALAVALPAAAASPDRIWDDVEENRIARSSQTRQIVPQRYRTVRLDMPAFELLIRDVPAERVTPVERSDARLWLPLPDGSHGEFRIAESPLMDEDLSRRFPQIRTWVGQGIDDPSATLRFDLTHKGFHAQILSAHGTTYIDPYQPGDVENYITYHKRDHDHGESIRCSVTGEEVAKHDHAEERRAAPKVSSGATLRTYRTAIAATGEYTAFHGGGVADGLAGIVTTMNRVTGIYEREVAVRFVLVGNNDRVIYTNAASDPFSNTSGDLAATITTINAQIGSANYDVGHLVGTGGGGVAGLGVICGANKARGLTGSGSPVGDAFDVDYVAHEIGHQFAGNHTFNGSGGNCSGGNRNASTAYEPGSGVSIQAYAGICGADNLQPNSEDFFTRVSLNEIIGFTTSGLGSTCGATNATGNAIPTVSGPGNFTIPRLTPFELTASGSDADGDALTFQWEQFNLGDPNAAGNLVDDGSRPIFRSFAPTTSPSRVFPSLRYILNNANAVPATAPLPGTTTPSFFTGEVLPSTARTMSFRVTARDNRSAGGGTNEATSTVTTAAGTGPFRVTAPNTAVTWAAGSSQTVAWDVAGTAAAPISTAFVRIRLSLDGGYTWPVELAASEANDGSADVTIPPGTPASAQARIRIEAVGNIYFDVSDVNFSLTGSNTAPTFSGLGSVGTRQGSPAATANVATLSDAQDPPGSLEIAVDGAPDELTVSVENNAGIVALTAQASCTLVAPSGGSKAYPVRLVATDGDGATTSAFVNVNVAANRAPTLGTYVSDTIGRDQVALFEPSADPADPDGNFQAMAVTPTTLPGGGTINVNEAGVVEVTTTAGTALGDVTVRVHSIDTCGATEVREFVVTVAFNEAILELEDADVTSGDGLIEPQECNELELTLRNTGTIAATAVSATISTSAAGIVITQPVAAFDDIPAGQTRTSLTPFEVSSDAGLVCLSTIPFDVSISFAGGDSPSMDSFDLVAGESTENYSFATSGGATLPAGGTFITGSNTNNAVVTIPVPAGFSFSVYDEVFTGPINVRASTNGWVALVGSGLSSAPTNTALPSTSLSASATTLVPYWDDLHLGVAGGGIYSNLVGVAPNRTWFIEWRGQQLASPLTGINTVFAVVFSEGVDGFEFRYLQTSAGDSAQGGSATIGVQAASTGTRFTQYSFNGASVTPGTRLVAAIPDVGCTAGPGGCSSVPGVVLAQSEDATGVAEGGMSDSYTVVLTAEPGADVTITPAADSNVTTSPPQLVFTAENWDQPQPITVIAVDDRIVEGAHSGVITHAASGGGYDAVSIAVIDVAIADNDSANYRFATATSSASESAGSIEIPVLLDFATSGSGDMRLAAPITVPFSVQAGSTATGGGVDYSLATGSVGFAVDGSPQVLEVTLVDDALDEPAETLVLALGAESGGSAGQLAAVTLGTPSSHTLTITDNDEPVDVAVLVTRNPGLVLPGGEVSFEVTLNNLSTGIDVASADFSFTTVPVLENVAWTCIAEAGADCPAAGTGLPAHPVVLERETGVNYSISGEVPAGTALGSVLEASATISVSAPYVDTNPSNNVSETSAGVGGIEIFSDGFETPPPP